MEKSLIKLGRDASELDKIDLSILVLLQDNCKLSLARIGKKVGLSAPSVIERIKKLEGEHVITGYHAALDARKLGKDITAFVGVAVTHPKQIEPCVQALKGMGEILECHHVTGIHTLLLKARTENTSALEDLIRRIRSVDGVERTETMIALSSPTERMQIDLGAVPGGNGHSARERRSHGRKGR